MKETASLSGAMAGALIDFLDAQQLPALTCRARLSTWEPDGRISLKEWSSCLMQIRKEHPRPALGLEIARHMQPQHGGMLGYLMVSCDSFGEFLTRLERFYGLMWHGFSIVITRNSQVAAINWILPEAPADSLLHGVALGYETGVAALMQILRSLCGETFKPCAAVMLGTQPEQPGLYEQFFQCPVSFDTARAVLSFPVSMLTVPIRAEKASLKAMVERQAEAQLRSLPTGDAFLHMFQLVLVRALKEGMPTVVHVSRHLAISGATLKRKLKDRGLTFQLLLDNTRLEMAKMYLENRSLSLAEISYLLAFSEQSAFSRSFKRWTGKTPQGFRRHAGSA